MKVFKIILAVFVAVCILNGCASKKTKTLDASVIEKVTEVETDKSKIDIIETIKRETITKADTLKGTAKLDQIKKPGGVIFENDEQKIKISYDKTGDSIILEGIQKAKKQIEEIRREIKQNNDKTKTVVASSETTVKQKESEPVPDTGWSGWTWFKIGIGTAVALALVWRFRKFIPYLNQI